MTEVETTLSPVALLAEFDQAIEARLIPQTKAATPDISPEFTALFTHLFAVALDAFPEMTPEQICQAFIHLAADHPVVERPAHVSVNLPQPAPEELYHFDRKLPYRLPTIVLPEEISDAHLGTNL